MWDQEEGEGEFLGFEILDKEEIVRKWGIGKGYNTKENPKPIMDQINWTHQVCFNLIIQHKTFGLSPIQV